MLSLTKITRSEMGAYLCIASNGVPPSVSKRMKLQVHCKLSAIVDCSDLVNLVHYHINKSRRGQLEVIII